MSQFIEFIYSAPISNKIWFTAGTYIGYINTATDLFTAYNTNILISRTVGSTPSGFIEVNCLDVANNLIYAGECGGTNLVTFDMIANTFSVTNLTVITGGYFICSVQMLNSHPVINCYSSAVAWTRRQKLIKL